MLVQVRRLEPHQNAARGADGLRGTLRVVLSGAFGIREVIPCLPGFVKQHPKLEIELLMSDRTDDLIAKGADMALRLGRLADSGFGARLLGKAPRLAIASPAYLARSGMHAVYPGGRRPSLKVRVFSDHLAVQLAEK